MVVAAFTGMTVVASWLISWRVIEVQDYNSTFGRFFFLTLGQLVPLYLVAAAARPDEVPPERLDLKRFYAKNSSYIWGAFSAAMIIFLVNVSVTHPRHGDYRSAAMNLVQSYFALPALILAFVRSRRLHSIFVPMTGWRAVVALIATAAAAVAARCGRGRPTSSARS